MEAEELMNESWVYQDATYFTRFGASSTSDKRYIATLTANRKYKIVHDNTGAQLASTVNGAAVSSYTRCNTSSTRLLCFGHRNAGQWLKGKVYEIKMTEIRKVRLAINNIGFDCTIYYKDSQKIGMHFLVKKFRKIVILHSK